MGPAQGETRSRGQARLGLAISSISLSMISDKVRPPLADLLARNTKQSMTNLGDIDDLGLDSGDSPSLT